MALFNVDELRKLARTKRPLLETAEQTIKKSFSVFNSYRKYDVFLSHAYDDADVILGLCYFIENAGYSVYLDWRDDPQMSRNQVTKETANTLRIRMKQSRSLIFAVSEHSSDSVWMPWELGYFDALKNGKVGVLPLTQRTYTDDSFEGQEYLGLYHYMVRTGDSIYVHSSKSRFVTFDRWLNHEIHHN
jgi:hypothetical protein